MHHEMRLHPGPFAKISDGSKVIESRMNDGKRRLIAVGDTIDFVSRFSPAQHIRTTVTALHQYPRFEELFAAYPASEFGGTDAEALLNEASAFYSDEEIAKYGVVGIRFQKN